MSILNTTYTVQRYRENKGSSIFYIAMNLNYTDSLTCHPLNAAIIPVIIRNRADNCTNILQLKVQALKAGLIRIKISREERNDAVIEDYFNQELYEILLIRHSFLNNNAKHHQVLFKPTIEMLTIIKQYISSSLTIGSQYKKRADLLVHDLHHTILNRLAGESYMELMMMKRHQRLPHIEQPPIYSGQLVERNVMATSAEVHVYMLLILEADRQLIEIVNGMRLEEWGDIGDSNAVEFKNQIGEFELVAINVHIMGRQWPTIVSNNTIYNNYRYVKQFGTIEGRQEAPEYTIGLIISIPRGLILVLKLFGILSYVGLYGYQDIPSPTHRWGDDNNSIYCATDSNNHEGTGIWGAIAHVNANNVLFIEDTVLSYPSKLQYLPSWWLELLDEQLVVLVFTHGIGLQSNYTHHYFLGLRSVGYITSHLVIKQNMKIGNLFIALQLGLADTISYHHKLVITILYSDYMFHYTMVMIRNGYDSSITSAQSNTTISNNVIDLQFGGGYELQHDPQHDELDARSQAIGEECNTLLSGTGSHPSQYTSDNCTCADDDDDDTRTNRTNDTPHHQRYVTATNDSYTTNTSSTKDIYIGNNSCTSTQQHVNDTPELATYYNTSWLDTIKGRTHANSSTVNGIGSTYSIEEMYDHTSGIYHCVHALIPVYGEHTNNTSSGSCYMVGINNMDDGTVRIVRTDDTRRYKPAIAVHYSSDNSHDHDRTKSRNNVPDTTQQCTAVPPTKSDTIQDVVLDLECDKNQYALRGHTSNKSTFTMMIHISDTQQCDYMHNSTEHTTDTIRINTVGTCDNGDGTVTIKDGERSSNVIPSSINSTICTRSNGRYNPSTNAIIRQSRIKKIKYQAQHQMTVDYNGLVDATPTTTVTNANGELTSNDNIDTVLRSTTSAFDKLMVNDIRVTTTTTDTDNGNDIRTNVDDELQNNEERLKLVVGDEEFEKIVDYNGICQFMEEQEQEEDGTWKFNRIVNHRAVGGGKTRHEVLVEWESGECTYIPISNMYSADKFLLAEYDLKRGMVRIIMVGEYYNTHYDECVKESRLVNCIFGSLLVELCHLFARYAYRYLCL